MPICLATYHPALCLVSHALASQAGVPTSQPIGDLKRDGVLQEGRGGGELPASQSTGGKAPGGQEHLLRGWLCHWSGSSGGSSSYAHTIRAVFDGQGRFRYGSESSFSSGSGLGYGTDGAPGNVGTYQVSGNQIYLTFSDGSTEVAKVHNRGADGAIIELIYDGDLYAAALCD